MKYIKIINSENEIEELDLPSVYMYEVDPDLGLKIVYYSDLQFIARVIVTTTQDNQYVIIGDGQNNDGNHSLSYSFSNVIVDGVELDLSQYDGTDNNYNDGYYFQFANAGEHIIEYKIPSYSIKSYSFYDLGWTFNDNDNWESLETKIELPSGILKIEESAFKYSTIKKITIPNSVLYLGDMVFYNSNVEKIELSEDLQYIGDGTFHSTANLQEVYFNGIKEPNYGSYNPFPDNAQIIYYPCGRENNYENTLNLFDPFYSDVTFKCFNKKYYFKVQEDGSYKFFVAQTNEELPSRVVITDETEEAENCTKQIGKRAYYYVTYNGVEENSNLYFLTDLENVWEEEALPANVNLNREWAPATVNALGNGYATLMSDSNHNVDGSWAKMIINIPIGFEGPFVFKYGSWAESSYDYMVLGELDTALNNPTRYSAGIKYSTCGNQETWNEASYDIDDNTVEHFIEAWYLKDGSVASSYDRGFVAFNDDAHKSESAFYIYLPTGEYEINSEGNNVNEYYALYKASDANGSNSAITDNVILCDNDCWRVEYDEENNVYHFFDAIEGGELPSELVPSDDAVKTIENGIVYDIIKNYYTVTFHGEEYTTSFYELGEKTEAVQRDNEIWYTTNDGNSSSLVTGDYDGFNVNLVENIYGNGIGVWVFDGNVETIGLNSDSSLGWPITGNNITSVTFPKTMTSFNGAFGNGNSVDGCSNLQSISIIGGGKYFSENNCIIDSETYELVQGWTNSVIPSYVTSIGGAAFRYSKISSITIPSGVTSIGFRAFYECSNLVSVILPDGVTTVEDDAFSYCPNLETLYLGNSLTEIRLPESTPKLTSIEFPETLTYVYSFQYTKFTEITFKSQTPPTLGNLYMSTTIPSSGTIYVPYGSEITYSEAELYKGVYSYQGFKNRGWTIEAYDIREEEQIDGTWKFYDKETEEELSASLVKTEEWDFTQNNEGVWGIAYKSYYNINYRGGVRISQRYVYVDWTEAESNINVVNCDGTVKELWSKVFNASSITLAERLDMYKLVFKYGVESFTGVSPYMQGSNYYHLNAIECYCEEAPQINATSWNYSTSVNSYIPMHVPYNADYSNWEIFFHYSGGGYTARDLVQVFYDIYPFTAVLQNDTTYKFFDENGAELTSTLRTSEDDGYVMTDDGKYYEGKRSYYTVSYNGENIETTKYFTLANKTEVSPAFTIAYSDGTMKFYYEGESGTTNITSNLIETGSTTANYLITEVNVIKDITTISANSFYNCVHLQKVVLGSSVTTIGNNAFKNCFDLLNITFNEGLTSFGSNVFENCWKLQELIFPNSLTALGGNIFGTSLGYYDGNEMHLAKVDFGGISKLTGTQFRYIRRLKEIIFNSSVTSISDYFFGNSFGLEKIICYAKPAPSMNDAFRPTANNGVLYYPLGEVYSAWTTSNGYRLGHYGWTSEYIEVKAERQTDGTYLFYDRESNALLTTTLSPTSEISYCEDNGTYYQGTKSYYVVNYNGTDYLTSYFTVSKDNAIVPNIALIYKDGSMDCFESATTLEYSMVRGKSSSGTAEVNLEKVILIKDVTEIGIGACYWCQALTDVVLCDGITKIGKNAFKNAYILENVNIPSSLQAIGMDAFVGTKFNDKLGIEIGDTYDNVVYVNTIAYKLIDRNITTCSLKNDTTQLYSNLFASCSTLSSITLPNSIINIGYCAFASCSTLSNITLPNNLTDIEGSAFRSCTGLTSVTIPSGVTTIGSCAFEYCYSLATVELSNNLTSIGSYTFNFCQLLTSITIPDSVTSIDENAFRYCTKLTSITLPSGITSISNYLFYECNKLTSVTIPNTVKSIGTYAFFNCKALTNITIPSGVTSIGNYAFNQCTALTSIEIPNSVTNIGEGAFDSCSKLASVIISNKITSINSNVFRDCTSLTEITIPSGIKTIGYASFYGCSRLASITIPNTVTSIGTYAFKGCAVLTSIEIPNSVTSISAEAFNGCTSLASITLPSGLKTIENTMFMGCKVLTNISIPSGVTNIKYNAFKNCTALTSITIPSAVTTIGSSAFYGCSTLASVNCLRTTPPTISTDSFSNNASGRKFYVPSASVDAYKGATNWSTFASVIEALSE